MLKMSRGKRDIEFKVECTGQTGKVRSCDGESWGDFLTASVCLITVKSKRQSDQQRVGMLEKVLKF